MCGGADLIRLTQENDYLPDSYKCLLLLLPLPFVATPITASDRSSETAKCQHLVRDALWSTTHTEKLK